MTKTARVLRVIEYEGDLEWVTDCINRRSVKGSFHVNKGRVIREAIIGEVPALLEAAAIVEKEKFFMDDQQVEGRHDLS